MLMVYEIIPTFKLGTVVVHPLCTLNNQLLFFHFSVEVPTLAGPLSPIFINRGEDQVPIKWPYK